MRLVLLLALAATARAGELGGHELAPRAAPDDSVRTETRASILEEMWERRILAPDQSSWAPADAELLDRIRRDENDALAYLKKKFGSLRPWTAPRRDKAPGRRRLTKEGYDKYRFALTQDAIKFFEARGAGAKWALKLTDWEGNRLFDGDGRLTPAGVTVYTRARLRLEVYWKAPNGETFGTRRPPAPRP